LPADFGLDFYLTLILDQSQVKTLVLD